MINEDAYVKDCQQNVEGVDSGTILLMGWYSLAKSMQYIGNDRFKISGD